MRSKTITISFSLFLVTPLLCFSFTCLTVFFAHYCLVYQEECNKIIGPGYADSTKVAMAQLPEKEIPFDLVEVKL